MSKDQLIYEVLLRVTGGVLTSDATTRYGEAEVYLAAAVNFVMTGNYYIESKAEGGSTINPLMWVPTENIPVSYDATRRQRYSDFPKIILKLPKGRALEINTMCGKRCIPLDQGDDAMAEYYDKFKDIINYQIEKQRVWWWNINPLITAVRSKQLVEVNELEGTDEIMLPSDGYVKVMDMMYAWLMQEQANPKDFIEDAKPN